MVKVIVHEKYVELTSNVFEKFTTLPNEKIPIEKYPLCLMVFWNLIGTTETSESLILAKTM